MGKSLNALNAAAGFVSQGKRVLFIENEDTLADTRRRFTQRLLRKPLAYIQANPEQCNTEAKRRGIDNFILTDSPDTPAAIEAAIKQVTPDVCVINQMRNLANNAANVVQELDHIAHALRRIGKQHKVVMYMITAAREGEMNRNGDIQDKHILQIGDVYSSRTGIPAVADLLIGWGGSESLKRNNMAYMSLCKNKIIDSGTHEGFYISVNPETGLLYTEE